MDTEPGLADVERQGVVGQRLAERVPAQDGGGAAGAETTGRIVPRIYCSRSARSGAAAAVTSAARSPRRAVMRASRFNPALNEVNLGAHLVRAR